MCQSPGVLEVAMIHLDIETCLSICETFLAYSSRESKRTYLSHRLADTGAVMKIDSVALIGNMSSARPSLTYACANRQADRYSKSLISIVIASRSLALACMIPPSIGNRAGSKSR